MRPHKYGAIKCEIDGFKFDSKLEAGRYTQLVFRQKMKEISELEVHSPIIECRVNGTIVCKYVPDFTYKENGSEIVEDVKGDWKGGQTNIFSLKKKLVKAIHGIEIQIWPPRLAKARNNKRSRKK